MPDKFGDKIRLQHALDAIETIQNYVAGSDLASYSKNSMMQDACIRQLQVIGEACSKVDPQTRMKTPEIPWRKIIGLRTIVIHEYFGVDEIIIWDVVENDLPSLKFQIENLINELE